MNSRLALLLLLSTAVLASPVFDHNPNVRQKQLASQGSSSDVSNRIPTLAQQFDAATKEKPATGRKRTDPRYDQFFVPPSLLTMRIYTPTELDSFEDLLNAHGLDLNEHWKRLILLCLPPKYANHARTAPDGTTWTVAREIVMTTYLPWPPSSDVSVRIPRKRDDPRYDPFFVPRSLLTMRIQERSELAGFEDILNAHGLDLNEHWQRLILLCLPPKYANHARTAPRGTTWTVAREILMTTYLPWPPSSDVSVRIPRKRDDPRYDPFFVPPSLPTMRLQDRSQLDGFEDILNAYGLRLDKHWQRLILLCLPPKFADHARTILHGTTWAAAREELGHYMY